jgi:hypothetical protein
MQLNCLRYSGGRCTFRARSLTSVMVLVTNILYKWLTCNEKCCSSDRDNSYTNYCRLSSVVSIATGYGLGGPGVESRLGARFSATIQIGPGAHSASYSVGIRSFPDLKRSWRGFDHPPLSSAEVKEILELCLSSHPVLGWNLCFITNDSCNWRRISSVIKFCEVWLWHHKILHHKTRIFFVLWLCSNGVSVSTEAINSHNTRDCITLQYWVVNLVFRYYVSFWREALGILWKKIFSQNISKLKRKHDFSSIAV